MRKCKKNQLYEDGTVFLRLIKWKDFLLFLNFFFFFSSEKGSLHNNLKTASACFCFIDKNNTWKLTKHVRRPAGINSSELATLLSSGCTAHTTLWRRLRAAQCASSHTTLVFCSSCLRKIFQLLFYAAIIILPSITYIQISVWSLRNLITLQWYHVYTYMYIAMLVKSCMALHATWILPS